MLLCLLLLLLGVWRTTKCSIKRSCRQPLLLWLHSINGVSSPWF
jgi:hypothetical protein